LDQPWFCKKVNRDIAQNLLKGKEAGTFLIRPSSRQGCYAMSYVLDSGDIRHDLIYDLYPGFSLYEKPESSRDRFWSLASLIEQCNFLKVALNSNTLSTTSVRNSHMKTM
jgi:SH2 domain.